jgi:anti-sigma regulatory factor (Ser/Thr protein kinase)
VDTAPPDNPLLSLPTLGLSRSRGAPEATACGTRWPGTACGTRWPGTRGSPWAGSRQSGIALGEEGSAWLITIDTSQGGESLAHQGLLYGSEEEFLAGTVPFIRDGLECDDPIWVVTTVRNAGWLRVALGADARRVVFGDCSQWYRHPVRALAALYRAVRMGAGEQRLRMIGEPVWTARTGQESKERARYESLLNVALASANASFVCAYDTRMVDCEVMTQVARTHPELVVDGGARPSTSYTDPAVFNAECDKPPLPEPPPTALRLSFNRLGQLAPLRAFMTSYATWAGAAPQSVQQFVQALDEVATNAIEHGNGSGVVRIWTGPHTMVCEVSDTGAGLRDPLAGHLPPLPGRAGGCGLWLARQFSDLVEVRSDTAGTTARLHLDLP